MSYDGISGKAFSPRRANYDGTDFIPAKLDLPSYELLEYWDGKGQSFFHSQSQLPPPHLYAA